MIEILFKGCCNWMLNPKTLLSIITAIVAIIALFQTKTQIKLNNKQFLYERREKIYTYTIELLNTYALSKKMEQSAPTNYSDKICCIESKCIDLTRNALLVSLYKSFKEPFDTELAFNMSSTMLELKMLSEEVIIEFGDRKYKGISRFLDAYAEMLNLLYKLKIAIIINIKNNATTSETPFSEEKWQKFIETKNELEASYHELNSSNELKNFKNEIKLK